MANRRGFTLMEMLIATGLIGIVLAMAMTGFTAINRISNEARSRLVAHTEAANAAQKIASIISKCQVIYFNGRPMADGNVATPALPANLVMANWPARWAQYASGVGNQKVYYDLLNPDMAWNSPLPSAPKLSSFRFFTGTDAATPNANLYLKNPLKSMSPDAQVATATDFDKYFPSPLFFGAQAVFDTESPDASGRLVTEGMPIAWNFYILYLAPMTMTGADDPLMPRPLPAGAVIGNIATLKGYGNVKQDLGIESGKRWVRSTIPFEIRLLTVPMVRAAVAMSANKPCLTAAQKYGRWIDATTGAPRAAPYDYDPTIFTAAGIANSALKVNYDPIGVPIGSGVSLVTDSTALGGGSACGPRVAGVNRHSNYDNIGNDPPADTCLPDPAAYAAGALTDTTVNPVLNSPAALPSDVVIAQYVDPDNVHGTCVTLANPTGVYTNRPYVNAYDTSPQSTSAAAEFPKRVFSYRDQTFPRRALVSVTTRYRTSTQVPFQFSTSSTDVDLEALVQYQSVDRTVQN